MKNIKAALICEFLKLKRSGIFWITITLFIFIPAMFGLMLYISQNPELMFKLGIVGTKAKLFGENDWKGYFGILNQSIATIGLIGFGFVTSWIFGSEYTNRTMKDLLALPVSRTTIVISKFIVTMAWCFLLVIIFFTVAVIAGKTVGLPGWGNENIAHYISKFLAIAFLTILLCTPVGFFASYGRGIIAPLGFVIITLILAQFIAISGLGTYFPWAIPGVYSVAGTVPGMALNIASYIILMLTFLAGIIGTALWWKRADHH